MRITLSIYFAFILISSCLLNSKTNNKIESKKWGFRYSRIDTNGKHSQGYETKTDCFPEFINLNDSFSIKKVSIYDSKINLVFDSEDKNRKWICNSNDNKDFKKGNYVGVIIYQNNNSQDLDTTFYDIGIY